jgi:hypothetical protein
MVRANLGSILRPFLIIIFLVVILHHVIVVFIVFIVFVVLVVGAVTLGAIAHTQVPVTCYLVLGLSPLLIPVLLLIHRRFIATTPLLLFHG